ncbi:MAG TPA: PAS domain-containing sensor histidine kinase [Cytophagales bacterium]|nr:PAS domain-containing sensor histidine kinase [Cytophagales bacterium]
MNFDLYYWNTYMDKNLNHFDRALIEMKIRDFLEKEDIDENKPDYNNLYLKDFLKDVLALNERVKTKEKWFLDAQRIAKIGRWEYDLTTNTIFWSDEVFKTFGMEPGSKVPSLEEYLQKIYFEDKEKLELAIKEAIEDGKPYELEIRHVMPDKSVQWVLVIGSPVFDESNQIIKLLGITYDLNDRKKGENALRASEQFFKALINNSTDYVQTVNVRGEITYQSPTFERLTGYPTKERKGKSVLELVHPEDRPSAQHFLDSVVSEPGISKTLEMRLIRKDAGVIWIESTLSNLLNEPCVNAIVVNTREITDRKTDEEKLKQQNDELRKINEELDSFVYRASHDLRAPLVSLLGLINVTKDENDEEVKQKYFGLMQKSVAKLDLFIKNIIDYSRNSRLDVSINPVNFKEILTEIFDELKYTSGSQEVTKQIQIEGDHHFFTDIFRLKIIFNNIISNAIRYRNPKVASYIHINIKMDKEKAVIVFKDNGVGIEKEYLDKIFNMFFRASDQNVGSGLGLYIVKQAIITLKGTIKVESEYGKGTTFILEIPGSEK